MDRHSTVSSEVMRRACPGCHAKIDAPRWQCFPIVATIIQEDLERVLTVRVSWTVEVRRCVCGTLIAAKASHGNVVLVAEPRVSDPTATSPVAPLTSRPDPFGALATLDS